MPSIINATTSTGLVTTADNSGSLQLATNSGTTAVTIDTSQNVGIGTTGPSAKLMAVQSNPTRGIIARFNNSGSSSQTGAQIQLSQAGIQDWAFGQPAGVDAFAFWSGRDISSADGTERMRIASDGTISTTIGSTLYGAYPARAWVNFNGTGTPAIRSSKNVSSITDNGTGDYTVNFTQAMPDNEYCIQVASGRNPDGSGGEQVSIDYVDRYATGSCRVVNTQPNSTRFDQPSMFVAIFR